jgi:hypothetical protein
VRPVEQVGKYVDDAPGAAVESVLAPGLKLTVMFGLGLLAWAVPVGVFYLLW